MARSRELQNQLLLSGLIVNQSDEPLPAPHVVERSHLLVGANLELTHAMLVMVGVLLPGHVKEADRATSSARRGQHLEFGRG